MPSRQQRAVRNRRAGPSQPTVPFPVYRSHTGNKVTIGFYTVAQPPFAPVGGYPFVHGPLPHIVREADQSLPTAVEPGLLPYEMKLTYGGDPIDSGENFYVGPYDPALALPTGGHVAPGQVAIP